MSLCDLVCVCYHWMTYILLLRSSASEMTYIESGGALNSTHLLTVTEAC